MACSMPRMLISTSSPTKSARPSTAIRPPPWSATTASMSEAFKGSDHAICYSMKANSNQAVIKTLADLGAGIDVVSEGELRRALAARRSRPQDRLFRRRQDRPRNGPWPEGSASSCFNVESEPELELLSPVSPSASASAPPFPSASIPMSMPRPTPRSPPARPTTNSAFPSPAPRKSMPGRAALPGTRCRRHRHAHRQPDHRARTLRTGFQADGRTHGAS